MQVFVLRKVIATMLWPSEGRADGVLPLHRHIPLTLLIWSSQLAVACSTDNLGIVLEITGGVSSTMLAFVIPGVCSLKLKQRRKESISPLSTSTNLMDWVLVFVGVISFLCSSTLSILHAFEDPQATNTSAASSSTHTKLL